MVTQRMGWGLVGSVASLAGVALLAAAKPDAVPPKHFLEAERFVTSAASQGVAVSAEHFYAIGTRSIEMFQRCAVAISLGSPITFCMGPGIMGSSSTSTTARICPFPSAGSPLATRPIRI